MRDVLARESRPVGITSLAVGADQLFARTVLALGGTIEVVLPTPAYRETFPDPDDRAAYEELLAKATKVTILPFPRPSEEAFMAAGQEVVDQSDRLIAIWDGLPPRGLGGTADVVAYAQKKDVAVMVIWPSGETRE